MGEEESMIRNIEELNNQLLAIIDNLNNALRQVGEACYRVQHLYARFYVDRGKVDICIEPAGC